jgi:heme/copper-type cytochrome/quinol oxidase subunit 3
MSMATTTAIIVLKTVILLLGSGITYIAYKAYRRTGEASLQILALGFGTITLGALLAGIANQILGVSLEQGIVINSLLVATGYAIIMYSLYIER